MRWYPRCAACSAHERIYPQSIQFGAAPPLLPAGAQLAVLEGDPAAFSGDFTIRLKMPGGYKIAPHWHPRRENVTVTASVWEDTWDDSKMTTFGPGSFAYLDPTMHHYAAAETTVQVHGMSPLQFNYVNPNDDPSRKK